MATAPRRERLTAVRTVALDVVDSTNAWAMRAATEGSLDTWTLVTAREQTAGRGTHGRTWRSPRDAGLYLSLVYCDPARGLPVTVEYTHIAAIACAEVLRGLGVPVAIKPVNDLVVNGAKLGGILVEAQIEAGRIRTLVVGVGINLRPIASDGLGISTISLAECGVTVEPGPLATALGAAIRAHIERGLAAFAPMPP